MLRKKLAAADHRRIPHASKKKKKYTFFFLDCSSRFVRFLDRLPSSNNMMLTTTITTTTMHLRVHLVHDERVSE